MFKRSGYVYRKAYFIRFLLLHNTGTRIIIFILEALSQCFAILYFSLYFGLLRAVSFGLTPIPIAFPIFYHYISVVSLGLSLVHQFCGLN